MTIVLAFLKIHIYIYIYKYDKMHSKLEQKKRNRKVPTYFVRFFVFNLKCICREVLQNK